MIGSCGLAEWKAKGKPLVYPPRAAAVVSVRRIWDAAPHNAFTDLLRYRASWFCAFREGAAHVAADGALRVIDSRDGAAWRSAARITLAGADLRDPKLTVTPDGRLMLTGAAATPHHHQTLAWFSRDGRRWTPPAPIGDPDLWLWRVTWHGGAAYSVGYDTAGGHFVRLYRSQDGVHFETLVDRLYDRGSPSEASLLFLPDGTALCLLRRDGDTHTAQLGAAPPPYREWTWKDLGRILGGPQLIRLPDGRILAAGRALDGRPRTSLFDLDPRAGALRELLTLPSGGDTSYPGLAWESGKLWVSYYSSHEGKTSIYLAKVEP